MLTVALSRCAAAEKLLDESEKCDSRNAESSELSAAFLLDLWDGSLPFLLLEREPVLYRVSFLFLIAIFLLA